MENVDEKEQAIMPDSTEVMEPVCDDTATAAPVAEETELARMTAERDALKDQMLRTRAEFDNYRKRVLRDGEQARAAAAQGIMRELLPVADNLERALGHAGEADGPLAEGVRMVLRQFMDVLAARGLEPIAAAGIPFDPNVHEALSYMPSDAYPAGVVMNEFERGYRLGSAVLRPSRVVVSSGAPEPPAESMETKQDDPDAAQ